MSKTPFLSEGSTPKTIEVHTKNVAALGYQGVEESSFSFDNPAVSHWIDSFHARFQCKGIFERFHKNVVLKRRETAVAVGTQWYVFSEYMPWFLSRAASEVSANNVRHYVIQGAFEELGMRKESHIHSDLFKASLANVGVTDSDIRRLINQKETNRALKFLSATFNKKRTDAFILGVLLGIEINAHENIETVFESLCHDESLRQSLSSTIFFKFHQVVELEHIRLAVSNFLRFCQSEEDKKQFNKGFDRGVEFWGRFWGAVETVYKREVKRNTK